jgi:hypothetical protein
MAEPPQDPAPRPEDWSYDLLLYGNEQLLRASDNAALVAFAAIAFQEIRGEKMPHHNAGFGVLIFSVLLCAVVHFAVGSACIGRARRMLRGQKETWRGAVMRRTHLTLAWVAGVLQLGCIVVGLVLVLLREPPAILTRYFVE